MFQPGIKTVTININAATNPHTALLFSKLKIGVGRVPIENDYIAVERPQ